MAFKFVALFGLIAAASAGLIPIEHHEHHHELPVEHSYPQVYHSAPSHLTHQVAPVHHVAPVQNIAAAHHVAPVQQHVAPVHHIAHQPQHVLLHKPHVAHEEYPDDPHPKYNFAYDVKDAVSGDSKSQVESRDGDVVHGEYSLDDADGFRRTVKYTADSVNGFNAVVHREPLAHAHKVIASAPAQYHHVPAPAHTHSHNHATSPLQYVAPAYAAAPAHHEHEHVAYSTYEAPHESHDYYHH